jgi:hypothetical protein
MPASSKLKLWLPLVGCYRTFLASGVWDWRVALNGVDTLSLCA